MVEGTAITKKIHSLFEACQPSLLIVKKVVLKSAWKCISVMKGKPAKGNQLTEMNVAGKKSIVKIAIVFTTALSCRTIILYACTS